MKSNAAKGQQHVVCVTFEHSMGAKRQTEGVICLFTLWSHSRRSQRSSLAIRKA